MAGNGPGTGAGGPSSTLVLRLLKSGANGRSNEIDIERLVNEKSRMRLHFINRLILV